MDPLAVSVHRNEQALLLIGTGTGGFNIPLDTIYIILKTR